MVEATEESTHVWNHKARSFFVLAAMRHRAAAFRAGGLTLTYWQLGGAPARHHRCRAFRRPISAMPARWSLEAGDYRLQQSIQQPARAPA